MAVTLDDKLVVAISSRALFDFEEENRLFDPDHPQNYMRLQLDRLDAPARPGVAFSLVKKLLAFNDPAQQRVEVVVLSRNDPVSGMRVFRSAKAHGLASVQRGVFTQGAAPFRYLRPLGAHLFLSANAADVNEALAWADCVATCAAGKPMASASFTSAALAERNRCAPRGRR
jgi:5'-nucleotidase